MNHVIYRKNDTIIEWTWLSQSTDGSYINDGTVTFTLYHSYVLNTSTGAVSSGTAVSGPIAMAYVSGSNGKYQGKLPASLSLDLALEYTIEINATANGHVARRSIPVSVVDRVT